MIQSGFLTEGYFDNFNFDAERLKSESFNLKTRRLWGRHQVGNKTRFEFAFSPNTGFLASPDLLLKDTELKISFDRTPPQTALLEIGSVTEECKYLEIKDCYAVTEYVSSPAIRDFYGSIEQTPFIYHFEEVDVLIKNLPLNETDIRFDNIRGGSLPSFLFIGLNQQESLNGSFELSSTGFEAQNITDINITLNGNSVHGYPMNVKNNSPIFPLQRFLDTTNQLYNATCGSCLTIPDFENNFLFAHCFEGEMSPNGWIGVNFKMSKVPEKPLSIVLWFISPCTLTVDKFHAVERINY